MIHVFTYHDHYYIYDTGSGSLHACDEQTANYLSGKPVALTDEELLQILDFNSKRDFALEQNPDVQQQRQEAWEEANDSDTLR